MSEVWKYVKPVFVTQMHKFDYTFLYPKTRKLSRAPHAHFSAHGYKPSKCQPLLFLHRSPRGRTLIFTTVDYSNFLFTDLLMINGAPKIDFFKVVPNINCKNTCQGGHPPPMYLCWIITNRGQKCTHVLQAVLIDKSVFQVGVWNTVTQREHRSSLGIFWQALYSCGNIVMTPRQDSINVRAGRGTRDAGRGWTSSLRRQVWGVIR